MTYEHPWNIQLRLLESTTKLDAESTQNPAKESLGQRRTDLCQNSAGDIAEMYVMLIAQWKGAKIHRNVSCVGNTDMVLQVENEYYPIDVKLSRWHSRDKRFNCGNVHAVKPPVYPVIVIPDGDIMDWNIRWKNVSSSRYSPPYCPPGLENFWSNPSTHV